MERARRSDGGGIASSIAWDEILCWSRMLDTASDASETSHYCRCRPLITLAGHTSIRLKERVGRKNELHSAGSMKIKRVLKHVSQNLHSAYGVL